MDGRATTAAELARLGGERAIAGLTTLGLWDGEGVAAGAEHVVRVLAECPNADLALRTLARLAERRPEAWAALVAGEPGDGAGLVSRAATVAGASEALGDLLAAHPEALAVLVGDLEAWDADAVHDHAREALDTAPDARARALAAFQRRGLLRVAARDLLGLAGTRAAAAELADLAEGVVRAALEVAAADAGDVALAVVGMGKLGGRELNYVSDIDLLFVAEGDWRTATGVAERLVRLLGEVTPDGRAYEVDTNLRPEGRDGPLVRSLGSYEAYYRRWAHTWEYQALLKARPVAGDARVGRAFAELVGAFVWPDRLHAAQVAEIRAMKDRIEQSAPVRKAGGRQLKLAPGGLRDIEFAVQLLQLVHGRHDPTLRSPNTFAALAALAEGGYVGEGDARLFAEAYDFLRTVEHRLQLVRLRRTHTIPAGVEARARLARVVGFRDQPGAPAVERFDREYTRVQSSVRRLHEKLFYRPLLERFAELGGADQVAIAEGGLHEEAARERLEALGFAHPDGALAHLEALAAGLSRRARLFRTLLPALLPTLSAAPDPDTGLAAFRSLADRLEQSPSFVRTLRDNPPVGELLARALGSSRVVGEWLQRQPEVISHLADSEALGRRQEPQDYHRLAEGLLRRGEDAATAGPGLRRLKRREVARIALRDLGGLADVTDVGVELTGLAEACLRAALAVAVPDGVRMAVIGLGKLGGAELAYSSDLDVLLVFEPAEARAEALAASEHLLTLLSDITPEGQAFRVDLGLRPEGKDGPAARSLDSYRTYYQRWGDHWEFQALTRARPVAGDEALGAAFMDVLAPLLYPEPPPAGRIQAVRRMKARVERERTGRRDTGPAPRRFRPTQRPSRRVAADRATATPRPGERAEIKLGPGGLTDVEWTVQLLQLREGGRHPEVRAPGTLAALDALGEVGAVPADDAEWLREGWVLLSRVRNALYLMGRRDSGTVPGSPQAVEHLARLLGYPAPGAQRAGEELARVLRRVRKVHERLFYAG